MFLSDPPASDLAEALYDKDRENDGYVSNTTRLWCWRPDVLKDFFGVRSTLSGGSALSPADQAVLFAATAAARSDSYCGLAWGTRLAGYAGPDTAAQVMTGSTSGLDPRGAALADWARRVARRGHPGRHQPPARRRPDRPADLRGHRADRLAGGVHLGQRGARGRAGRPAGGRRTRSGPRRRELRAATRGRPVGLVSCRTAVTGHDLVVPGDPGRAR